MADIIVDPGGGEDYTTIQDACDNASAGDVIKVNTGTYNENVDIDQGSGSSGNEITIQANTGQTVTMSPSSGSQIWNWQGRDYWIFDFDSWVFTPTGNMKFINYSSPAGNVNTGNVVKNATVEDSNITNFIYPQVAGVHLDSTTVQDCVVGNYSSEGIFVGNNGKYDNTLIERCWFHDYSSNRYGVVIYTASNAGFTTTVRNCIFSNGGAGIYDGNSTQNHTVNFYNNTIYNTNNDGALLNSSTRAHTYNFKNNVFHTIGDYCIDDPNTSATNNFDYNSLYSYTTGKYRNATDGSNDQDGDPGLTNPGSDDFTLDGSGNADGNGVDLSGTGFSDDYDGTTRSTWDIGAYYYEAAAPAEAPTNRSMLMMGVGQ